jgi:GH15 family glucan-1,4-alpha-glucosidase
MTSLYQHSIETLTKHQYPSGAFPAAPNFAPYQYSWFRDGAFISYALDSAGYPDQSELFHRWCAQTVLRHSEKISKKLNSNDQSGNHFEDGYFHCRFTEEGEEVPGHWGNHQLDGLGTWLWSLEQHLISYKQSTIGEDFHQSVDLIADYLLNSWSYPCSDCWEENESDIHFSTLAAVYAGLMAHSRIRKNNRSLEEAQNIRRFVHEKAKATGYLTKSVNNPDVDASLLWVGLPYEIVDLDSSVFKGTLERIEQKLLSPGGGIHRYPTDSYYGGGEWLLLSAWYGWVKLRMGDLNAARNQLVWLEKQADQDGSLPEQVKNNLIDKNSYRTWVQKWGQSANPLLWSHAMYIILINEMKNTL